MELVVRGWMEEDERLMLRRRAFGQRVLEIGSFQGLSTINMAVTASSVTAVDPFDGRATFEPGEMFETFLKNVVAAGLQSKVKARRGTSAEILPNLKQEYDLVFIDGDHSYEAVKLDIELSLPLLADGGVLMFHDYNEDHPGVARAVNELLDTGAVPIEQANSLVAISLKPPQGNSQACVSVVMPHRNLECVLGAARGLHFASRKIVQVVSDFGTSVLTQCFNTLLADSMNSRVTHGVTHFAMLHNDVVPCENWLDILMEEMNVGGYDMVSAVIPLKNYKGLTSTGIDTPGNPWSVRRLTMTEIYDLPETFTAKDVSYRKEEAPLVLNTGCWLMKLDQPWSEGLHFRQQDRIAWCLHEQKYAAQSISEDWDFSRQLFSRGCRLAATRKVPIYHERQEFHNRSVWGTWATDEDYMENERIINQALQVA